MIPPNESDVADADTVHAPDADGLGRRPGDPDRGDVPGWVLITMMTAGLVVMLWALAGDALSDMFQAAMARVSNVSGG
ncbi:hypothetical protein [Spelaeicoccus albus]|uniref:Uncharacterized protein n=1 Tax=Spelaeicoccus albus TaxID=1280376 RepID=A0A7Z0D5K3_9MICO|nr:hypothetical protein [Spelaeicoccus albus]NYI69263.1 hypothetical protein [Spelaeicoccus albus]